VLEVEHYLEKHIALRRGGYRRNWQLFSSIHISLLSNCGEEDVWDRGQGIVIKEGEWHPKKAPEILTPNGARS
jgi:hypothetical protein